MLSSTSPRRRAGLAVATTAALALAVPVLTAGTSSAKTPAAPAATRASVATSPLIFGHRGAAGYRPEHTLASYDLAVRMGADVIEPDLVSTKDHQLVARHENDITGTTDVASHPEFADRKATKTVDGSPITGWFTEDFTLAELRTLRAVERLPQVRQENTIWNGRFTIPTLQDVIDLAALESKTYHRKIGIAPETKHPTYFRSIGLPLEEPLLQALNANDLNRTSSRVYVQSFEQKNLQDLRAMGLKAPEVQLTSAGPTERPYDHVASGNPETYAQMTTFAGLRQVATYATWLGPDKTQIAPRDSTGRSLAPTRLVADAHRAGLLVVPYTFRAENQFLPAQYRSGTDATAFGDEFSELQDQFAAGVDGVFCDQADICFAAREDLYGFGHSIEHPQAAVTPPPAASAAAAARGMLVRS